MCFLLPFRDIQNSTERVEVWLLFLLLQICCWSVVWCCSVSVIIVLWMVLCGMPLSMIVMWLVYLNDGFSIKSSLQFVHFFGICFFPVALYQFDDHNAPPFELMLPFCSDVEEFLGQDPKNVAVVHCKAGKVLVHYMTIVLSKCFEVYVSLSRQSLSSLQSETQ